MTSLASTATLGAWRPDVVLLSPDCRFFSTSNNGHWHRPKQRKNAGRWPATYACVQATRLVRVALQLVEEIDPAVWIMENPVGMLRRIPMTSRLMRYTVHYCQYGADWQKPTDLWGRFPADWRPRGRCRPGDACHPRRLLSESNVARRALVPAGLSLDICRHAEEALGARGEQP